MFAYDLSYFCTITISTITTIITFSSFTYIKNLFTQILDKPPLCDKGRPLKPPLRDKEIQTDGKIMIHSETQTESGDNVDIDCNSYIAIEYITNPTVEDSLENLMLLAKDQLVIQQDSSNYKWFF